MKKRTRPITEEFKNIAEKLKTYLLREAYGRAKAKIKPAIVEAVSNAGAPCEWRTLCAVRRYLLKQDIPIASCNDGWFIAEHLHELAEMVRREHAKAMHILEGISDTRKAFHGFHKIRVEHVNLDQEVLPV
ncbi:hypothetical protein LCGC14_0441570 [marine sediment metagenome]|uniref:Uncharacterized protein n=1 Tax=marine sediment metagenome TaxID=412755 RepID=A0A0F9SKB8_9ZZZZ